MYFINDTIAPTFYPLQSNFLRNLIHNSILLFHFSKPPYKSFYKSLLSYSAVLFKQPRKK
jgi:hypothetical protein